MLAYFILLFVTPLPLIEEVTYISPPIIIPLKGMIITWVMPDPNVTYYKRQEFDKDVFVRLSGKVSSWEAVDGEFKKLDRVRSFKMLVVKYNGKVMSVDIRLDVPHPAPKPSGT